MRPYGFIEHMAIIVALGPMVRKCGDFLHLFLVLPLTIVHCFSIVSGNGGGMAGDDKQKQPLSAAERQRLFKERQREAGFRDTTVWIHTQTEEEGRQAARDGKPLKPIGTKDPLSWAAGWISEKSKQ